MFAAPDVDLVVSSALLLSQQLLAVCFALFSFLVVPCCLTPFLFSLGTASLPPAFIFPRYFRLFSFLFFFFHLLSSFFLASRLVRWLAYVVLLSS